MQAVTYRFSVPRYLLVRGLSRFWPGVYCSGLGHIKLATLPRVHLPGDEWLLLHPIYAGVCGTDLGAIRGETSPALAPFASFPAVLGHEIVARVVEAGPKAGVPAGTRVVVNPFLSCQMRGLEPCPACTEGKPYLCRNSAEGQIAPAMLLGFCRDLPGGWGEELVAHNSQVFPVPEVLSNEKAVLVEPLAIGFHAVLRARPAAGARVLVLGGGSIGLCVLAGIRLLGYTCDTTVITRYPFQAELAQALGADHTYTTGSGGAGRAAREVAGASSYRPPIGREVFKGGFDVVFDCVGSRSSLDDSLRVCAEGGTLVLVGGAGELPKLDWTFVWVRELNVLGSCGYGPEDWQGRRVHTFELVMDSLQRDPGYPIERLITHRAPLAQYRQLVRDCLDRRRAASIKAVFTLEEQDLGDPNAS